MNDRHIAPDDPYDPAAATPLVRQYVARTLHAEVDLLERLVATTNAGGTVPAQPMLRNLRDRPHVVKLIESRAGDLAITMLQHAIWALRKRLLTVRRLRARLRRLGRSEAAEGNGAAAGDGGPHRPPLSSVAFDRAILRCRPRILIDVTPTARQPQVRGGIPRVVRELAEAAVRTGVGLPVCFRDGALYSYYAHELLARPIQPRPGDVFLIIDVFWYSLDMYQEAVRLVRGGGAQVALFLHDIFPLRYPSFYPPEVPPTFRTGLMRFLPAAAWCLTSTAHGEAEIRDWLATHAPRVLPRLRLGHFPLGVAPHRTDRPRRLGRSAPRRQVTDLFDTDRAFLSVGTLEPRKGYDVTLDACDLAWAAGEDFIIVIIGRYGWRARALQARLRAHPELGQRLFLIEDATDAELAHAYAHCRCLIQSSIDEGYGLPVIEASLRGAPVIATDIAVFREIAGEAITYYPVADAGALAARIAASLSQERRPAVLRVPDWDECVRAMADRLAPLPEATRPVPREVPGEVPGEAPAGGPALGMPAILSRRASSAKVHVACCFDDRMAIPASVVAASVAAATPDADVVFHMLHPPALSIDLGALADSLDSDRFTIAEHVITEDYTDLHRTAQYSDAIYYRFQLPSLIDADRVIYVDSDTMVRRSLAELYRMDLRGHPVAAMTDFSLTYHMRNHAMPIIHNGRAVTVDDYMLDVLDFDLTTTPYFNSGVLLMDLAAWRRIRLVERCLAFCRAAGELNMPDQDALNQVLRGDYLPLDPRWNAFSYLYREYMPEGPRTLPSIFGGFEANLRPPTGEWMHVLRDWAYDPWIVHFAYRSKPWAREDRRTDYDAEFWDHARRTPFGERLAAQCFGPAARVPTDAVAP